MRFGALDSARISPSAPLIRRRLCRLITLYQRIHEAIHLRPTTTVNGGPARAPAKLVYLRTEYEAVLGWVRRLLVTPPSLRLFPLIPQPSPISSLPSRSVPARRADNLEIRALPRRLPFATQDSGRLCRSSSHAVD